MEFTSGGGAKVVINLAPFDDAMNLKAAVMRQLSKSDIGIDLDKMKLDQDIDITALIRTLASLDASPEVNEAAMKCLIKCTYNGEKITKMTFEPAAGREDYYEIMLSCIKENLSPFFRKALSGLNTFLGSLGINTQKLELTAKPDSSPSS